MRPAQRTIPMYMVLKTSVTGTRLSQMLHFFFTSPLQMILTTSGSNGRLNRLLMRGNAAILGNRLPTHPPPAVDGFH